MRVSVSDNRRTFKPCELDKDLMLEQVVIDKTYSLGIFKDNHRTSKNFMEAHYIGLDFDEGLLIENAKERFKDHWHIIAPTRNHMKLKNGKIEHRFRVILRLSAPIVDNDLFKSTCQALLKDNPEADPACVDAARMFYASSKLYSTNYDGKSVDALVAVTRKASLSVVKGPRLDFNKKPPGFTNCIWSIANGHFESGQGNSALMALTTNVKHLGYTKEQAYYYCKNAIEKREKLTGTKAEKDDLWREIIEPVYGGMTARYVCAKDDTWLNDYCTKLGTHACKKTSSGLRLQTMKQLMENKEEISWVVDGLFSEGGLSIIVAQPKCGKSTLTRQLAKAVCRGDKFLGRSTKKGKVLYLALEEQVQLLKSQFRAVGVNENDDIVLHVGSLVSQEPDKVLIEAINSGGFDLVVVDTLFLMANVTNSNDYNEVNSALEKFRAAARETNAQIVTIHHSNKSDNVGPASILGSSAIHGAVDCAFMLVGAGDKRYVTTSQRGGVPFRNTEIKFDKARETYTVKGKKDRETTEVKKGSSNGF